MAFQTLQTPNIELELNGKFFELDLANESNETDLSTAELNLNKPFFEIKNEFDNLKLKDKK
jgi:hypothetical protein